MDQSIKQSALVTNNHLDLCNVRLHILVDVGMVGSYHIGIFHYYTRHLRDGNLCDHHTLKG